MHILHPRVGPSSLFSTFVFHIYLWTYISRLSKWKNSQGKVVLNIANSKVFLQICSLSFPDILLSHTLSYILVKNQTKINRRYAAEQVIMNIEVTDFQNNIYISIFSLDFSLDCIFTSWAYSTKLQLETTV